MSVYEFVEDKDTFNDTELTELALEIITDYHATTIVDPEDSLFKSSADNFSNDDISSVRSYSASTASHNEEPVHLLYPTQSKYNDTLPPIKIPSRECKRIKSTRKHPYISFTPTPKTSRRPKFHASSSCHIPIAEVSTIERKNVMQHRVAIIPDFSDINLKKIPRTSYKTHNQRKKKRTSRRSRGKLRDRSKSRSRKKSRNRSSRMPHRTRITLAKSKSENQRTYDKKKRKHSIEHYNEYAIETDDGFLFINADAVRL